MSGERPEFGQRKLAAGLRGFDLYPAPRMQSPSCPLAPVGLETWLPESLGLGRPGFGGWPGVGRSGERPEFGLRKLAAGLRGLELCPVGAGHVYVEGWPCLGGLTGCSPLSSVELFPYQEFRYWKRDVDEGWD